MKKNLLLILFFVLVQNVVFSQNIGDYQSSGSGNWTSLSSWKRWSGTQWVMPTLGEGYPGQYTGTGAVLIQSGDIITIGDSGITTVPMGTLTISGSLVLTGVNNGGTGTNFYFNTSAIIVTPLLGTITFIDKVNLKLPANAILQVTTDTTPNPDYFGLIGNCNHNQDIYIGTLVYAYCNGGGSTALTFEQVMAGGGTLNAIISSTPIVVCQGGSINFVGSITGASGTGLTYAWSIKENNTLTATGSGPTATINDAVAGTYTIVLTCNTTYNGNAYTNSETIYLNVNALPITPTATASSQPTCVVLTGTITVTAPVEAGMNYTIDGSDYSNTTGVFTFVAAGEYSVTAKNASGCISSGTPVSIIAPITKTWIGCCWTPSAPTSADIIVFEDDYSSAANVDGCSCQVNSGVITILAGGTLTITNAVAVLGGTLTFENNASLVQVNNAALNTGSITYKRTTTPIRSTDYTYWSSPVSPQTLFGVSPDTSPSKFFFRDAVGNKWVAVSSTTVMDPGVGYIIRGPLTAPYTPTTFNTYNASFYGEPNNGVITATPIAVTLGKNYLVGNPYPSAIDAVKFLQANPFLGTLYFWTHNTAITADKYVTTDYATFNLSGGTGSAPSAAGTPGGANKAVPSGKIASGQAFFASTIIGKTPGKIVFNNDMRIAGGVAGIDNSQFFKMSNNTKTASKSDSEIHRIWLNLTNSEGLFKQTLVAYLAGATNEFDYQYDGRSFNANVYADFYSVNSGINLTIQGRALPFDTADQIPLGYKSTIAGVFNISIDHVEGALVDQPVFLEDKTTNTMYNLKNGPYSFSTLIGTFNDRFVLRYTNNSSVNKGMKELVKDEVKGGGKVIVSVKNHQIKINSFEETIAKVLVFDLRGRKVYEKENVYSNEFSVQNLSSNDQFLIVRVLLKNGTWVTEEIVF